MNKHNFILILVITLLSINLIFAFSIDDYIPKGNSDAMTFLFAIAPLLIMLLVSFVALRSRSRMMVSIQFLLWWILAVYYVLKLLIWFDAYANIGLFSKSFASFLYSEPASGTKESDFYFYAMIINGIGSLFFAIKNNVLVKTFIGKNAPYVPQYSI
jgi:hypothetical protein